MVQVLRLANGNPFATACCLQERQHQRTAGRRETGEKREAHGPVWVRPRADELERRRERGEHEGDCEGGDLVVASESGLQAEGGDDRYRQRVALPRQLRPFSGKSRLVVHSACTSASTSAPSDSSAKQVAIRTGMRDGCSESPRSIASSFARQRP